MKAISSIAFLGAIVPALAEPSGIVPRADADFIDGRYIVQLKPGTSQDAVTTHHNAVRSLLRRRDGSSGAVERTFQIGEDFKAYAGTFNDATLSAISELDEVYSVEQDQVIRTAEAQGPPPVLSGRNLTTQANSTWSLGDLSHLKAGAAEYVYDGTAGEGTTAYLLDSGIRLSHDEFEGRASFGFNALTNSTTHNGTNSDEHGHGTHVAAIIAGRTFGVAKMARVIDVKVFGSSGMGSITDLLAGLEWAVKNITAGGAEKRSVLNMSLGLYTKGTVVDNAVLAAYKLGILSVVAAGNSDAPAGFVSPARLPEALTVGMTGADRARVSSIKGFTGSNYGPQLDVFAPGFKITSASHLSDQGTTNKTGTSMAAPHVAGLVCYLRALEGGLGTPKEVTDRIVELAIRDVVGDPKNSPNLLANNGSGR